MENLSTDHKDRLNQNNNSHTLRDKTSHLVLSLIESQRNLRQPHDQNIPIEGKL